MKNAHQAEKIKMLEEKIALLEKIAKLEEQNKALSETRSEASTIISNTSVAKKERKSRGAGPYQIWCAQYVFHNLDTIYQDKKRPHGITLKVAGLLKEQKVEKPGLEDVKKAIKYLTDHPEHLSAFQKKKQGIKVEAMVEKVEVVAEKVEEVVKDDDEESEPSREDELVFEDDEEEWCEKHEQKMYNAEGQKCSGCMNAEKEQEKYPLIQISLKGVDYLMHEPSSYLFSPEGKFEFLGKKVGKIFAKMNNANNELINAIIKAYSD